MVVIKIVLHLSNKTTKNKIMKTMIRASGLRIGNLVYFNGRYKEIGKVTAIATYESGHVNVSLNGRKDISYTLKEISPIELTEEILLKCGLNIDFNKIKDCSNSILEFEFVEDRIDLWITSKTDEDITVYSMLNHIKYLHQLQNLYHALTDQELTINKNN